MLEERVATWPKQWMAEGYRKGRASGLLEGRRMALAEQVEEKFGALAPRHADLIAEATADQLRRWFRRILTADTADDLFRS